MSFDSDYEDVDSPMAPVGDDYSGPDVQNDQPDTAVVDDPDVGVNIDALSKFLGDRKAKVLLGWKLDKVPQNDPVVVLNDGHYFAVLREGDKVYIADPLGIPVSRWRETLGHARVFPAAPVFYQYYEPETGNSTATCGYYMAILFDYLYSHPKENLASAWKRFSPVARPVPGASTVDDWIHTQQKFRSTLRTNDRATIQFVAVKWPELIATQGSIKSFNAGPNVLVANPAENKDTINTTPGEAPLPELKAVDRRSLSGGKIKAQLGPVIKKTEFEAYSVDELVALAKSLASPLAKAQLVAMLPPQKAYMILASLAASSRASVAKHLPRSVWMAMADLEGDGGETMRAFAAKAPKERLPPLRLSDFPPTVLPPANKTHIINLLHKLEPTEASLIYSALPTRVRQHFPEIDGVSFDPDWRKHPAIRTIATSIGDQARYLPPVTQRAIARLSRSVKPAIGTASLLSTRILKNLFGNDDEAPQAPQVA